jgi:hypothetical protein
LHSGIGLSADRSNLLILVLVYRIPLCLNSLELDKISQLADSFPQYCDFFFPWVSFSLKQKLMPPRATPAHAAAIIGSVGLT